MSVYELKDSKDFLDMYEELRRSVTYAKEWTANIKKLHDQLSLSPHVIKASPDQKAFIDNAAALADVFSKDVPSDPDAPAQVVIP